MASVGFPQMSEMRTLSPAWEGRGREGAHIEKGGNGKNLVKFDWKMCLLFKLFDFQALTCKNYVKS